MSWRFATRGTHRRSVFWFGIFALLSVIGKPASAADGALLRAQVASTMHAAARFYRDQVASHGGYVYYYSVDLKQRWGEGRATTSQIWVQPPGTPTVGRAFLKGYTATGDVFYRDAARAAAEALVYGQLESGGWMNCIDFDPHGRVAQYRNGRGRGKNNSSLDDDQTQSAIRFLIRMDKALGFKDKEIHRAAQIALDALLAAQFTNGGFPQVWTGPVASQPITPARYPDHDWRTEGRIKDYWNMYTLNDNVCGYVAETLIDAARIYADVRYINALHDLGDFLILAQMPKPQPAWAQQYNFEMQPIWARKFEPPAIAGDESQEAIDTLLTIYSVTGDDKYLVPIPRALTYLRQSLLSDGRLARYYELQTNRPLYMRRQGGTYTLTYDDSHLPGHYVWKLPSRLEQLERRYRELRQAGPPKKTSKQHNDLPIQVQKVLTSIDAHGRWISTYRGERLVGQPKLKLNSQYIGSAVFSHNLDLLSEYLITTAK